MLRVRSEVLEALYEWFVRGGGAQDALDDAQLYSSLETFLGHHTDHNLAHEDNPAVRQATVVLEQIRQNLQRCFLSKTKRPTQPLSDNLTSGGASRSFGSEPPDIDRLDAEELVNNLDSMASAAFQNVTQEVSVILLVFCAKNNITYDRTYSSPPIYSRSSPQTALGGSCRGNPVRSQTRWRSSS